MKQATYILGLATCFALLSCHKNKNTHNPTPTYDKKGLSTLFAVLKSSPQTFTITVGSLQTIVGAHGTELTFYPNSFKDAGGNVITSGTISIELTEMYTPGAMIANGSSATAGDWLLRCGGQANIRATKDGQEVFANVYKASFLQPEASTQPMAVFYGNNKNEDSIITWSVADTTRIGVKVNTTGYGNEERKYVFDSCKKFNWINCDYFYKDTAPLTYVNVIMPDTSYNPGNTRVFMVFPFINSVYGSGYSYVPEYTFFRSPAIPRGMGVNVIVITIKDGKYYYAEHNGLTATSYLSVNAKMNQVSLGDLVTRLKSL